MKKYAIAAIVMAIGVSGAFAASIGIPLFIDNAARFAGVPSTAGNGVTGIVTLKNMTNADITCTIQYYNLAGDLLGPFGANATFGIKANSSLGFRPVVEDPSLGVTGPTGVVGALGGQEGAQGVLVPDRPRSVDSTTVIPGTSVVDLARNGSITISWTGGTTDINGQVTGYQTSSLNGAPVTFSYSHLIAPGAP